MYKDNLLCKLSTYGLVVLNNEVTRDSSLIDWVVANEMACPYIKVIVTKNVSFSDHCLICFNFKKSFSDK